MRYLHHIPGRIRIRSEALKGDPARAQAMIRWLEGLEGVEWVYLNPLIGSVLVHYHRDVIDGDELIAKLQHRAGMHPAAPAKATPKPAAPVERAAAKAIFGYVAEMAVERALVAALAALL